MLKAWNRKVESNKNKRLNSFSIVMLLLAYMLHSRMLVNLQRAQLDDSDHEENMLEIQVIANSRLVRTNAYVAFETDIGMIDTLKAASRLKNTDWTAADILFGFLQFYIYKYKPDDYMIHIGSHFYHDKKDKVIFRRKDAVSLFDSKFDHVKDFKDSQFCIRDPINRTYNPARVKKSATPYSNHFIKALKTLLDDAEFIV